MNVIAVLVALLTPAAQAAPSALESLSCLDGGGPAPARFEVRLEGKPCELGRYKGTCFFDPQGGMVYWILRDWSTGEPKGRGLIGYPAVQQKQREYNVWLRETLKPKSGEYLGVCVFDAAYYRGLGWNALKLCFAIPDGVHETGELTLATLSLPYFRSGARIQWLWNRYQRDCTAAWKSGPVAGKDGCAENLALFDRERIDDYLFPDSLLRSRAEKILIARDDLQRFVEVFERLPIPPDALADMPVRLRDGLAEGLAAVMEDVDLDIRAAETAAKDFGPPGSEKDVLDGLK